MECYWIFVCLFVLFDVGHQRRTLLFCFSAKPRPFWVEHLRRCRLRWRHFTGSLEVIGFSNPPTAGIGCWTRWILGMDPVESEVAVPPPVSSGPFRPFFKIVWPDFGLTSFSNRLLKPIPSATGPIRITGFPAGFFAGSFAGFFEGFRPLFKSLWPQFTKRVSATGCLNRCQWTPPLHGILWRILWRIFCRIFWRIFCRILWRILAIVQATLTSIYQTSFSNRLLKPPPTDNPASRDSLIQGILCRILCRILLGSNDDHWAASHVSLIGVLSRSFHHD